MPTHKATKAELMSKIEKLVDRALESGEHPLTLTQIEDLVLEAGRQIEAELTNRLLEQQTTRIEPHIPDCPQCGNRMHRKGNKKRHLHTRSGETGIERPYFYCKTCRQGFFPPG